MGVAVVTRGGDTPGTLYLHADNLGSVDVLTNAKGGIEERRSYDLWGKRSGRPAHPHAVTAAGGEGFGYNAVGIPMDSSLDPPHTGRNYPAQPCRLPAAYARRAGGA